MNNDHISGDHIDDPFHTGRLGPRSPHLIPDRYHVA